MICVECGSEMRFTDEPMTEEFQGQEYTVEGIDRWVCDSCGNDVVPLVSAARLLRGLREQALHDDTTVWGRLFGTPVRAAETIRERELACTSDHVGVACFGLDECSVCPLNNGLCSNHSDRVDLEDYDEVLGLLNSEWHETRITSVRV